MSEDKNEKLPKFDGTGYTLWKRRMDLVFVHHELLDVVEMEPLTINPTAAFLKKDYRAKYFYQACVSDKVFEEICDCEYATEMHTALDDKYNVQSVARQVQLQMELQKVYRKYEETFADYYRLARGIQHTLKDAGYETEEATFCTIVYQGIRLNDIRDPLLATVKASDLNYNNVQERLHQLDTMYPLKSYPKKNESQSNNRRSSWSQESRGSQRGYRRGGWTGRVFYAECDCHCKRLAKKCSACNICKSENHWSCCCDKRRSCEANLVEASYNSEDEEQVNLFEDIEEHALIGETEKENEDDKDEWFIDSGASASVAFNKQSFLQYDLLSTPIKIRVGNNAYICRSNWQGNCHFHLSC
jgi:hypothetical protein